MHPDGNFSIIAEFLPVNVNECLTADHNQAQSHQQLGLLAQVPAQDHRTSRSDLTIPILTKTFAIELSSGGTSPRLWYPPPVNHLGHRVTEINNGIH